MGWQDKAKAARLPEATETVVLRADLAAEYDDLTEQIGKLSGNSLAGTGKAELEARREQIRQEIEDSSVEIRLRALPRHPVPGETKGHSWSELRDAHPPRFDDDGAMYPQDRMADFLNADTIREPLLRFSIVEIDGEPVRLTDAEWEDLTYAMSEGQFTTLFNTAFSINRGAIRVPFSSSASPRTRISDDG